MAEIGNMKIGGLNKGLKKIIANRVYNTETAILLKKTQKESLFRKRTGEYFLFSENETEKKIVPLNWNDAILWAKEHLSGVEYEIAFGKTMQEDELSVIPVRVTASLLRRIRNIASSQGISVSIFVRNTLGAAVLKYEQQNN